MFTFNQVLVLLALYCALIFMLTAWLFWYVGYNSAVKEYAQASQPLHEEISRLRQELGEVSGELYEVTQQRDMLSSDVDLFERGSEVIGKIPCFVRSSKERWPEQDDMETDEFSNVLDLLAAVGANSRMDRAIWEVNLGGKVLAN